MMEKCGYPGNYFLQKVDMLILLLGLIHQVIKNLLSNLIKSKYFLTNRDFNEMNFTLKKPYKGKGKQKLTIQPGHE